MLRVKPGPCGRMGDTEFLRGGCLAFSIQAAMDGGMQGCVIARGDQDTCGLPWVRNLTELVSGL